MTKSKEQVLEDVIETTRASILDRPNLDKAAQAFDALCDATEQLGSAFPGPRIGKAVQKGYDKAALDIQIAEDRGRIK